MCGYRNRNSRETKHKLESKPLLNVAVQALGAEVVQRNGIRKPKEGLVKTMGFPESKGKGESILYGRH